MTDFGMHRRDMLKATGAGTILAAGGVPVGNAAADAGSVSDGLDIEYVEADPDAGFEYPYYLYAPAIDDDYERPILVEPNNTGYTSDDFEDHRDAAESLIDWRSSSLSDPLGVPMLVPVFPRPHSEPEDWTHYVHALDVETMEIDSEPLERVDLQLISMIEDAKSRLADHSFPVADDILMNGFSASGNFANRFTALHPELVRSVTAGGINGTAILPLSEAAGHTLPYQIGIDDLSSLVGEEFDDEAWAETAQLVYMGGDDDNDTIPYPDAWNSTQREIALDVYGEHMQEDRMPYCASVYEEAGATGRVTTYPNVGHRPIDAEIVDFHRKRVVPHAVEFSSPPAIGAESVQVHALTTESETYEVRVFDDGGNELSADPAELDGEGALATTLELSGSLSAGETVEVALVEPGQTDPAGALASETAAVAGRVELVETPVAGESAVTVEYELAGSYSSTGTPRLRLDTEQGGAAEIETLAPGAAGSDTFEVSTAENGIPFEQARAIVATIVDDDPYGIDPIATDAEPVGVPDEPAVSVDASADPVVKAGDEVFVEASIRTLGGDPDDLEDATVSFAIDEEVVDEETVSLEVGETRTASTTIEPESHPDTAEFEITAAVWDETDTASVIGAAKPTSGDGTSESPYQISTGRELAYVHFELDAHYELASAIDLSQYSSFFSIGRSAGTFSGVFDGTGYDISGLTIDSTADSIGLFSELLGGEIRNLRLVDVDVAGGDFVGGLVGIVHGVGTLSRIRVTGTVVGESDIGGLVGGSMTGSNDSSEAEIERVAVDATVAGERKVGGLLGQSSGDSITNCYSLGELSSSSGVGGLIGHEDFGATLETSYSAAVFDSTGGGGLIASGGSPTVVDSYWDEETTGTSSSVGGGTPLSTGALTGDSAANELEGFDFESVWTVTDGYPALSWERRVEITAIDAPDSIELGDPFPVSVTVTNDDDSELDDAVELVFDGELIDSIPVTLDPGSSKTVDFDEVETAEREPGEYDYLVSLDEHSLSRTVTVLSDEPAFELTDVSFPETVVEGTDATLSVEVTNYGPEDEQSLTAAIETADGEAVLTEPIADVSLEQEATYADSVELDTGSLETGDFELFVELDEASAERSFSVVEGSYVEFNEQPAGGETTVTVNYSASSDIEESDLRLRVGDESDSEITESPGIAYPGDEETGVELSLTRLLEAGEAITVALLPSGGWNPSTAIATETVTVFEASTIDFADQPESGDTDAHIECFVSPGIEAEQASVYVGEESGADLTEDPAVLSPGDEKTDLTISLVRELEADESVTVVLVTTDAYDPDLAIASETRTVDAAGGGPSLPPPPEDDPDDEDESDADEDDDQDDEDDDSDDEDDDDSDDPDDGDDGEEGSDDPGSNGDSSDDSGDDDSGADDDGMPGFGIVNTIGTIGGLGYLVKRRLEADETE